MITKQQVRINCSEEISMKIHVKKWNIIRYQQKLLYAFGPFSSDGYKQQIRINYIEEISMKSDAKKGKYYQTSKKLLQASGQFSCHDNKTTN